MFSESQYNEVVRKLNSQIPQIQQKSAELDARAAKVASEWYLPEPVAWLILELKDKIIELAARALNLLNEILEGLGVPFILWQHSYAWENVRGVATGVAADVNPASLGATQEWTGAAATAYTEAITPQSAAAARLGASADKVAGALETCAVSGLAFYVAVVLLVAQLIMTLVAASAAAATGAGAPPGLLAALSSGAFTFAAIVTALGAFLALLAVQNQQLAVIHGEAVDHTAYPEGKWPRATSG